MVYRVIYQCVFPHQSEKPTVLNHPIIETDQVWTQKVTFFELRTVKNC